MSRAGIGALLVGCAALFAACGDDATGGAGGAGAAGDAPRGVVGGVGDEPNPVPGGSSGAAGDHASAGAPSMPGSGGAGAPLIPGSGGAGDLADAGNGGESGGSGTPPPPAFAYAVLPTSLVRDRCLYDAARRAVYTNNEARYFGPAGVPRVERHRFVTDAWVTDSLLLNGPPRDIALTLDHRELVALSPSTLYQIDLDTWTIIHHIDLLDAFDYPYSISNFSRIAISGSNTAIVLVGGQQNTLFNYDLSGHTFAAVPIVSPTIWGSIAPVGSADGTRILFGQNGISGPLQLNYYDTALAQFVRALPDLTVNRMSYDKVGATALIDGSVYDRDFQLRGFASDLILSVISPDGTRAYGYVDGTPGSLRTYDVTTATPSGEFAEAAPRIELPDTPGTFATLGISDDGHTVFLSGEENFIVQPLADVTQ